MHWNTQRECRNVICTNRKSRNDGFSPRRSLEKNWLRGHFPDLISCHFTRSNQQSIHKSDQATINCMLCIPDTWTVTKKRLARQTSPQTPKNLVKWLIWMGIGWASSRKRCGCLAWHKQQGNWFWFLLIDVESRSQKGFSCLLESFCRLQKCQFWFNLNSKRLAK